MQEGGPGVTVGRSRRARYKAGSWEGRRECLQRQRRLWMVALWAVAVAGKRAASDRQP